MTSVETHQTPVNCPQALQRQQQHDSGCVATATTTKSRFPAAPAPAPAAPHSSPSFSTPATKSGPEPANPGSGISIVFAGGGEGPVEEPVQPAALARGQTERFRVGHPTESGRSIAKLWPRLWEPIFDVTLIIHKPPPGGRAFFQGRGRFAPSPGAKPWTGSGLAWRTGHESALPPEAS